MSGDPFSQNDDDVELEIEGATRKKKWMLLLLLVILGVLVGGGAYFYFYSQPEAMPGSTGPLYEPEEATDHGGTEAAPETIMKEEAIAPAEIHHQSTPSTSLPATAKSNGGDAGEMNVSHHEMARAAPTAASTQAADGPVLLQPENNSQWNLDGTMGFPVFTWNAAQSATLMISRDPKVEKRLEVEYQTKAGKYEYRSLMPGTYYWKVVSAFGVSEIRTFVIQSVSRRNIFITSPAEGSTVSGDSVDVVWNGDEKIRLYKVQYSIDPAVFSPQQEFQTVGTEMTVAHLPKGLVWIRVAAFSLVSEQWEYTKPVKISIQ